jgi:hypothetical protein
MQVKIDKVIELLEQESDKKSQFVYYGTSLVSENLLIKSVKKQT